MTGTRTLRTALHPVSKCRERFTNKGQTAVLDATDIFTEDLKKKFPVFRPGRDQWEALCTVCKAGTYVSVSSGGARDIKFHLDTERHKKDVQGESSLRR